MPRDFAKKRRNARRWQRAPRRYLTRRLGCDLAPIGSNWPKKLSRDGGNGWAKSKAASVGGLFQFKKTAPAPGKKARAAFSRSGAWRHMPEAQTRLF